MTDFSCPLPLRHHDRVVLGHGGGGVLSAELVEQVILPAFGAAATAATATDAFLFDAPRGRLAITTDTYVVRPLRFPGGDIGSLAVHGSVNDLAMMGAQPVVMTTGMVLEEGLELAVLADIARSMGAAAAAAGVRLVAGDTKVVEHGHGDGIYINTTAVGVVADGTDIGPHRALPGDAVIVSGEIGVHGIAVLSVREGLQFGTEIVSDSAPLNGLVAAMLAVGGEGVHVLRDPTRGGLAASLCELATTAQVGVDYDERLLPVPDPVRAACGFLGLDPMHVANEGKLVAFVAADVAEAVLAAMHAHEYGRGAVRIGTVTAANPGVVVARSPLGTTRVVQRPLGEQLPRIC